MEGHWESIAVAGVGLALVMMRLFVLIATDLNHKAFLLAITKLLRAGNRDRALKLTRAAPEAHTAIVARAMMDESAARTADDGESLVRESLLDRGRLAIAAEQRRMRKTGWFSIAGALLAAIGAFIGFSGSGTPPNVLTGLVIVAVLGALASWHKANKQVAAMQSTMASLADELTTYVMRPS